MREKKIQELIHLSKPLGEIKESLKSLDWDSDDETPMTRHAVKGVLTRFINKEFDSETLCEWANLIEGREDIDYDDSCHDDIKQLIFEAANPDLEGPFDSKKAHDWIRKLS